MNNDSDDLILNIDDVILNIYEITPTPEVQQQNSIATGFFNRILKPAGFGTYHTSITLRNSCYTFAAGAGIVKTNSIHEHVPDNVPLKESINLGRLNLRTTQQSQGEINKIITNLRKFFHGESYHLANRNCNHFTETFSLALLMMNSVDDEDDGDILEKPKSLETYPDWVNRLARTGTKFGLNGGDVCKPWLEACEATGADNNVKKAKGKSSSGNKDYTKKKELTEKQKALLAKLKKGKA